MNKTQVYTNIELSLIKDKIGMDKRKELTEINNVMRQFTEINPFAKYDDLMAPIGSDLKTVAEYKNPMASITSFFNTSASKMLDEYKNQPARVKSALDVLSKSTLAPPAHPMTEANKSILAMNREDMFLNSMTPSLHQNNQRIQEIMKNLSAPPDTFAMLPASLAAQSKLFELQRFPLGAAINAAASLQDSLSRNLDRFTANYRRLVDFTDHQPIKEVLKPDIIQYPAHEVFREAELLEQITVPEDEQVVLEEYEVITIPEERTLEDRLGEINSDLLNLLQGARAALSADNPDRARHVTVSLRELIGRVLHQFAPKDKIKAWSTDHSYYDEEGKPTRRARLLYICREINSDPLSKFVDVDVKSVLTLIQVLNAETHVIPCRLTDRQLQALVGRTESCLQFLFCLNYTNE